MFFWIFFLVLLSGREVLAREPTVAQVQEATLRYMEFNIREADDLKKRSRWASALPRLQVGFDRSVKDAFGVSTQDNVSVTSGDIFVGPNENSFDHDFDQGSSYKVTAIWLLNELVFNADTLAIQREKRGWIRERTQALAQVTEAFFNRKRLAIELRQRLPKEVRERKLLQLSQASATVDAFTGGWFSEEIKK